MGSWARHPFPIQSLQPPLAEGKMLENRSVLKFPYASRLVFFSECCGLFPLSRLSRTLATCRESGVPGTAVSGVTVPKNEHPLSRVSAVLLDSEGHRWGGLGHGSGQDSGRCGHPVASPRDEGWGGEGLPRASGRPGARSSAALMSAFPGLCRRGSDHILLSPPAVG